MSHNATAGAVSCTQPSASSAFEAVRTSYPPAASQRAVSSRTPASSSTTRMEELINLCAHSFCRRFTPTHDRVAEIQAFEPPVERATAQAKHPGRGLLVAAGTRKRPLDVLALDVH